MINQNLLNKIRNVSAAYHLPDIVIVYRAITEVDIAGGITTDDRVIYTVNARIIAKNMQEEQTGGGLASSSKWQIILPSDVQIRPDDKIKIKDDALVERYYLVIDSDYGQTEGLFTTADLIERWS
jgi:hypothetical protein